MLEADPDATKTKDPRSAVVAMAEREGDSAIDVEEPV